jgi:hypothetical protein
MVDSENILILLIMMTSLIIQEISGLDLAQMECEGLEKAIRGGGGGEWRQSKFLTGTRPMSQNRPNTHLF